MAGTDDEQVSDEEAPADIVNEMPVQVKLANFWPNNAAVWFVRAEQEFVIKSVSTQATKYAYLVQALTEEVSMRVADRLIADPSATPYNDLKAHLLKIYTKTDYQKAKLLLELPPLGDQRPSELMHKMLGFLPAGADTSDPGFLFRAIFLERMPVDIRTHLVALKAESMAALADKADELYNSRPPVTSFLVDQADDTSYEDDLPVCAAGRGRGDPASASADSSTQCWYHATYGSSATKCRSPCSFRPPAGNGQRWRQRK